MASSVFDRWLAIADIALGDSDIDAPFATYDDLIRLQKEAKILSKKVKNQTAKAESMKRDVLDNRELLKIRATNLKTIIEKLLDVQGYQHQEFEDQRYAPRPVSASAPSSASSSSTSPIKFAEKEATPPTAQTKVDVSVPMDGGEEPQPKEQQVSPNSGKSEHNRLSNGLLIAN